MARRLRLQFPGAVYHVFNHGRSGNAVFGTADRARGFLDGLDDTCARLGWKVYAYALLPDCYHLVVATPEPNLVEGMRWLQGTFATRRTRSGDGRGPQFHGRYHSVVLEPGETVASVVDYVHVLPLLRGIVAGEHLGLFRWGSLHAFRPAARPSWLEGALAEGIEDYERSLQTLAGDPGEQARRGFDRIGRGLTMGSAEWSRAREADHARLALDPRAPVRERSVQGEADWERRLDRILADTGRTRAEATGDRKAAPWKIEVASRLRASSTATNAWITARLHMGAPGAVSRYVGEWRAARLALAP
jgi:REP element-mobilizing transposase RayT